MELRITVAGVHAGDEIRSLRGWLVGEEDLRGHVRLVERMPEPGDLGSTTDALVVALGPGGVATVLASVLIAWLRQRQSDLTIKTICSGERRSLEISAKRLKSLSAADIQREIAQLRRLLDDCGREVPSGDIPAADA